MTELRATSNGFTFGAMTIEAAATLPGGRTVATIRTATGKRVDVYCSLTGRSLRFFKHAGWREGGEMS